MWFIGIYHLHKTLFVPFHTEFTEGILEPCTGSKINFSHLMGERGLDIEGICRIFDSDQLCSEYKLLVQHLKFFWKTCYLEKNGFTHLAIKRTQKYPETYHVIDSRSPLGFLALTGKNKSVHFIILPWPQVHHGKSSLYWHKLISHKIKWDITIKTILFQT